MSGEIFEGQVTEVENTEHAAYLLNNNEAFYDIGFRVMKNQERGCLMPCHRLKYNGNIKLVYFTDDMLPLSQKLLEMDVEHIGVLLVNLFDAVKEIEGNGFLSVNCVESRLERIYVDNRTSAVKLIYLPINLSSRGRSNNTFESEIRSQLIRAMQNIRLADHPKVQTVIEDLMDGALRLDDISRRVQGDSALSTVRKTEKPEVSTGVVPEQKIKSDGLTLKSVDGTVTFCINKEEFVIGKNPEKCNGVISGNPAISRVHCKVELQAGEYYLVDMGSSNGTYLNNMRLAAEARRIESGSRIKIANMEFTAWR